MIRAPRLPAPWRPFLPRGGWVGWLSAVLVLTFAAVAWVQWRQFELLNKSARYSDDNIVSTFFQVEIEYLALREALRESIERPDDAGLREPLLLRFELFVNRVALIDPARVNAVLSTKTDYHGTWLALSRFVQHADPVLEREHPGREQLKPLQAELDQLRKPVHDLSVMASQMVMERNIQRNNTIRQQIQWSMGLTAFLSLTVLAFAAIVVRQWRVSSRRSGELEDLAINLRAAREAAEAANQAKGAFLTTMSHELRTPFNGLLGMLSLLEGTALEADQTQLVRTARDSAEHLLDLLNDVLDVSQLEAGKLDIHPSTIDLCRLLSDVDTVMAAPAHAKGLSLTLTVDQATPQWVQADARRVKQVLYNLLSNAIKFTERGGVTLAVRATTVPREAVELTVSDTGIGMDAATLGRLFQRFSQGDASISRRYGGTGLGLEISRNLARKMGGDITATGHPGRGSQFHVWLPLPRCKPPMVRAAGIRPVAVTTRPGRILVVEDHAINRQYIGALLTRLGHHVRFATNGEEAVRAVEKELPDLILMDVHMPGMDGVQATRILRSRPAPLGQVKIIALTADAITQTREQVLAAGMDDLLTKPFGWEDVANLLAKHLGPAATVAPEASAQAMLPPSSGPRPLLCPDTLSELQSLLTPAGLQPLLQAFFDDRPSLEQLCQALAARELTAIAKHAHYLKGAAHILGLQAIAQEAARIEGMADSATAADLARVAESVSQTWQDSLSQCRQQGLVG